MNPIKDWIMTNAIALLAGLLILALVFGFVQTLRLAWVRADIAANATELQFAREANKAWKEVADAAEQARADAEALRKKQAEQAADAIAKAEQDKADAERDFADFKRGWNTKPASCAIALTNMEAACASSLSDY